MVSPSDSKELSLYATVLVIFITHDIVNALLLSPWNVLRCTFWDNTECSVDEEWMLNWFSAGHLHVMMLLLSLTRSSMGNVIAEQRLVTLVSCIMASYLTNGIYELDNLNRSMALLQGLIYFVLLVLICWHTASAPPTMPLPSQLRSASFDRRRRLPLVTLVVGIQFAMTSSRVLQVILMGQDDGYLGDSSSALMQIISKTALNEWLWTALILGWAMLLATPDQQRSLMQWQTLCLFGMHNLLAGSQGGMLEQQRLALSINFVQMMIALVGAMV